MVRLKNTGPNSLPFSDSLKNIIKSFVSKITHADRFEF